MDDLFCKHLIDSKMGGSRSWLNVDPVPFVPFHFVPFHSASGMTAPIILGPGRQHVSLGIVEILVASLKMRTKIGARL